MHIHREMIVSKQKAGALQAAVKQLTLEEVAKLQLQQVLWHFQCIETHPRFAQEHCTARQKHMILGTE